MDEHLSFDQHISAKVKKANSMSAIIRRTFQHLDHKAFIPLYKTFVRTHLNYASSVWYPYKSKHIEQVEGVQRRATQQIPGFSVLTYEERLKQLKLPSLKYRRYRGDMIEMFKLSSGKYDPTVTDFIKYRKNYTSRETGRGNSKKLFVQRTKLDLRKYSFTVRTAKLWNSLPEAIVSAKSLNSFKNKLDKFWEKQDVRYNYKADITYGSHITSYDSESDEEDLDGPVSEISP